MQIERSFGVKAVNYRLMALSDSTTIGVVMWVRYWKVKILGMIDQYGGKMIALDGLNGFHQLV